MFVILIFFVIFSYNRLIVLKNRVEESWSDINIQLKRRYDLVPNLVETVKGYATHEKSVFENVAKARSGAISAVESGDPKQMGEAENVLSGTLKTLFAVSENYPELKASEGFLELQRELRDTEDKIQASRRFYNTNVKNLNIKIEKFPSNIIASIFKFTKKDLFDAEEAHKEPVQVKF